ncbi:hypothetical protein M885DRAFT_584138 [Pelagophyceae sp. CCMP2097]|nr:hypothetical protein M885DRAFT_584138 [Pelagophyceae sp. CCMP2097]
MFGLCDADQGCWGRCAWRAGVREAYELSVVSLAAAAVATLMGAVSAFQSRSATALGYTLENVVDSVGSALLLWRFSGGGGGASKAALELRERRADVGISIMFVVLALIVAIDAAGDLANEEEEGDVTELIVLYTPSMLLFLFLGLAKMHVGRAIRSPALRKDGVCSLAGALLSFGVLVSALLEELTDIWWADSLIALVVAGGLGLKGVLSVAAATRQGVRWWSLGFWMGREDYAGPDVGATDENPLL